MVWPITNFFIIYNISVLDKDVNEFWHIQNPWIMLSDLIAKTNSELEPRLIGEVGKNTLLACYRVGLYLDKKILSSGNLDKISTIILINKFFRLSLFKKYVCNNTGNLFRRCIY